MSNRILLLFGLAGLILYVFVGMFQSAPGYMDADYYFAGGIQLVSGNGFTEPYLWNYLDDPEGLPHSSHSYWMPLTSIVAAFGMIITNSTSWPAARIGFLLVAILIPPLTSQLAYSITSRRDLASISGLLALFSGLYLPFLAVSDSFSLYMVFGGIFLLILGKPLSYPRALFLGILAGLMHLTRADGIIWLFIAILAVFLKKEKATSQQNFTITIIFVLIGYFLLMGPWFARNVSVFGTILAPGGTRLFWLTRYDEIFSYPASQLSMSSWLQSGWDHIFKTWLWALGINLANTLTVQGAVFLFPLILLGVWELRRDKRIVLGLVGWVLLMGMMTILFPYAGARGGFFHAGSAFQPLWWAIAPLGLERVVRWGARRRGWVVSSTHRIFHTMLVGLAVLTTVFVFVSRVWGGGGDAGWDRERILYSKVEQFILSTGGSPDAVVIIANPPGYYLVSGRPAIVVPDGSVDTIFALARRYGAQYLVLEEGSIPIGLVDAYASQDNIQGLPILGEVNEAKIYAIRP